MLSWLYHCLVNLCFSHMQLSIQYIYISSFGQLIQKSYHCWINDPFFETKIDREDQRKLEKYEDVHEQCIKNSWSIDIFPFLIGCWGFISNVTSTFFTKLGLSPAKKREYIKKDPKQDCNCIWTDMAFIQIKHHPIKSYNIVRYCWGALG